MSERPGVMLYFTVRPSLRRLSIEQKGLLFEAVLDYGENAVVPDFDDDPALAIAWDFIRPAIDKDGEMYEEKKRQASYAAYCREAKRRGMEPLSRIAWESSLDIGRYREISPDEPDYLNHPITVPIPTSIPNPISISKSIAVGGASRQLSKEQDFNDKRNEAMRMLEACQ